MGVPIRQAACLLLLCLPLAAQAGGGRLLATGGLTQLEGAAGGGLVPWAVLAGYGTADETGGTIAISHTVLPDYNLSMLGLAYTFYNRVEISAARQSLALDLGSGTEEIRQDILGAKVRLTGDLVYDTLPQLSLGLQYKRNRDMDTPEAVGAERKDGVDAYLAVSRLFLGAIGGYDLLLNGTLRATRANELGLLGQGGPDNDSYKLMPEISVAVLLNRSTAVGYEYRRKPDNLGLDESHWHDVFFAWFPSKQLAFAAALVDAGSVGPYDSQRGLYLSLQGSF
ncbi:MAG: DUF3034 family protein [Ectothiorhodospiraceae bacterium]|nr:DUF3034 family protein [Ectothiorhodospiraceae bacterium]MCH8505609.1 DUF3034 family protein [Ectothiorhodospiraceae bacterium]